MYDATGIAQIPTSEVCIIFSQNYNKLVKKFANHRLDTVQVGKAEDRHRLFDGRYAYWTDLKFMVKKSQARLLESAQAVIEATLDARPMVGRTTVRSETSSWTMTLEYPIPYMNVHPMKERFQVDVGPVILVDRETETDDIVSRLELGYVMSNTLEVAEFAIRRPTVIGPEPLVRTLHYSQVVEMVARNELFTLDAG